MAKVARGRAGKKSKADYSAARVGFEAQPWQAADTFRKYMKPPDKQDQASALVLEQAEVLCAHWAA